MTFRPMPLLSVFTLSSLAVLILLGNWQYERYAEKTARPDTPSLFEQTGVVEVDLLTDTGALAQSLYGVMDGEPVWRRYIAGRLAEGGEPVLVLFDVTGGPNPVALPVSEATGPYQRQATVFLRETKEGGFARNNDPEKNLWYRFDGQGMAVNLGLATDEDIRVVEPLRVTVRNADNLSMTRETTNPYATVKPLDPLPPERHFGYALTWWGLAIGLLGVYVALHHARGRLRFRSE